MSRGRRAQPDAVKALKGNPGKRKLALDAAGKQQQSAAARPAVLAMPEFLTTDEERDTFRRIIEDYLQRRVARASDLTAYARWAVYVSRWVSSKKQLDGKATWIKIISNHGERLARHPLFKDLLDLERVLQSLEDRLGLNPVARQNIIKGLSVMPAALGGLFGEEQASTETEAQPEAPMEPPIDQRPPDSPLGWMANAGKPH